MSLIYCLGQISVHCPLHGSCLISFCKKEIGLGRYGLVITFVCFLSNFHRFPYVFNLSPVCINNGLTKVTLMISGRI